MLKLLRKIIVVQGKGGTGKTSSIKLAAEKMGIEISNGVYSSNNDEYEIRKYREILFAGNAFSAGTHRSIGISSQGDNLKNIQESLKFFEICNSKLGIIILAIREKSNNQKTHNDQMKEIKKLIPDINIDQTDPFQVDKIEPNRVELIIIKTKKINSEDYSSYHDLISDVICKNVC